MNAVRLPLVAGIAALAVGLLPAAASAAAASCTRYASVTGSDSNDGVTAPYRTIQKLVDNLGPGDTGCAHGGTYTEPEVDVTRGGTQASPVTLTSAPNERATLRTRLVIKDTADYVDILSVNLDGEDAPKPSPTVVGDHAIFNDDDVTTNGMAQICFNIGDPGPTPPLYGNDTTISNSRIHDCGDKSDPTGNSQNHHHGIYVVHAIGTKILDNYIYDNAARGIQFYPNAQNSSVVGNRIDGNGEGIVFSSAGVYSSNNNVVERNVISNSTLRYNVYGHWSEGSVGTGNIARDNCVYATHVGFTSDGGIAADNQEGVGFLPYNNKIADPAYVDRAAKDFRLSSSSPCNTIINPWMEPTALAIGSAPAVASWGPGRLDVFARYANGTLFHRWLKSGVWYGPEALGGSLASNSAPAAVSWCEGGTCSDHKIDVFARGTDNSLQHKWWDGTAWSSWESLGQSLNSSPAASSLGYNRVEVFWRGTDNSLQDMWWNDTGWHGPAALTDPGTVASASAATSWAGTHTDVFWRGNDNSLQQMWWNSTGWHGPTSLGGTITTAPAASAWSTGTTNHTDVFARSTDNALWHKSYDSSSGWSSWSRNGGQLNAAPGAVAQDANRYDVFTQGTDGTLWRQWWDGSTLQPFSCPTDRAC